MLVATIETRLQVREDSQTDFALGNRVFFACLGKGRGFTQERFSNFSNSRFFQAEKLLEKTLSARKNIISNITLSKTSHLKTWTNLAQATTFLIADLHHLHKL